MILSTTLSLYIHTHIYLYIYVCVYIHFYLSIHLYAYVNDLLWWCRHLRGSVQFMVGHICWINLSARYLPYIPNFIWMGLDADFSLAWCQVLFDGEGKVFGVTSEGETARCKKVVCDPSYLPNKVIVLPSIFGDHRFWFYFTNCFCWYIRLI